jgi:serine protease
MRNLPHLIVGALLAAASFTTLAERTPARPQPLSDSPSARVIVQFKDGASTLRAHALSASGDAFSQQLALSNRAQSLASRRGLALRSGAGISERSQVVHGPAGMTSQALADQLAADPDVEFAVPDHRMRRLATPNDTLFLAGGAGASGPASGQWYLRTPNPEHPASINAQVAWDTAKGDGVIVAVLDTGVRPGHADLQGKLVDGYDFVSNDPNNPGAAAGPDPSISNDGTGRDSNPEDPGDWVTQSEINANPTFWEGCPASSSSWHGTQVAGIVGAATDNGAGMAGTGWNVRVMPVRVLGKCFGYTSDIQAAMRWAAGLTVPGVPNNPNPAQVINLSLGGTATCNTAWSSAVADVTARGVVVVAAAGNSAGRAASAPANCAGVIGVAGVRHVGSKVGFSDVGSQLAIAAPGGNCVNLGDTEPCLYPILSTSDTGTTTPTGATFTNAFDAGVGTSFSSPQVAGVVALMLSARAGLTPAQVKSALQSSARAFPTGLTDAQTGQPLPQCRAPNDVDQFECICTTRTCGAGMLDAAGAVAAALGLDPGGGNGGGGGGGDDDGGGGGGGTMSAAWLLALCAAVALLWRSRRSGVPALLLAVGAASVLAPTPSHAAPRADAMVHGLIVQLRDAPSHESAARERAQRLNVASAEREQARWQRVVASVPASLRVTERRAVGESAQLLRFERPLSRAQAQAVAAQLARHGDVAWAAPNVRERRLQAAMNAPNDTLYDDQWWLKSVALGSAGVPDVVSAWLARTTGSADAVVAVLDNGIASHPELTGKIVLGPDLVSDRAFSNDNDGRDADPSDPGDWVDAADLARPEYAGLGCAVEPSSWHGTVIAGMLAAVSNNAQGVAGMNWPGRVLVVRVAGKCGADAVDIIDGIRWVAGLPVCLRSDASGTCTETSAAVAQPRARVVNISFGGDGACDSQGAPYQAAIDEARTRGVVIVAAAGNEYQATPTRPAKCDGVVGVVALNRDGFKSTYSNFGPSIAIATVGGDDADGAWGNVADSGLLSVANGGPTAPGVPDFSSFYGTSFSTPVAAGAAGLMLAVNANLTAAQVEQGLRASARPHVGSTIGGSLAACSNDNPGRCLCTTGTCGAGILDVPQALAYAAAIAAGTPYTRPNWPQVQLDTAPLRALAALGPDRPANPSEPPSTGGTNGGDSSDGGGGTASVWWLGALALGTAALVRSRAG